MANREKNARPSRAGQDPRDDTPLRIRILDDEPSPGAAGDAGRQMLVKVTADDPETAEAVRQLLLNLPYLARHFGENALQQRTAMLFGALLPEMERQDQARRDSEQDYERRRETAIARGVLAYGSGMLDLDAVYARMQERIGITREDAFWLLQAWEEGRLIFSVGGTGDPDPLLYPAYQFDTNFRPHPGVAHCLAGFPRELDVWQLAVWMVTENGCLAGRRPADLVESDTTVLYEAARQARA